MQIKSTIVQIPVVADLDSNYIEKELTKLNITPLRWAIVNVSDKMYTVSVANLME